jgi:hypothetical protein
VGPGPDQTKGMMDRAAAVIATWFLGWMVTKGWLGASDSAVLLPAVILLPSIAYGAWVNRDKALIQSAGNVVDPKTCKPTIIVTSPEMAAATPDQNNIVSNTDVKVTKK